MFLELFSRIQHLSASLPLARPYPDITPSPQFTFVERQLLYSHLCFYPPLSPGLYFSCLYVQRPSRSPVRAALNAYSGASTRRRPKTAKLSSSWVAVCVARNRRMRLGRRRTWRRRWTSDALSRTCIHCMFFYLVFACSQLCIFRTGCSIWFHVESIRGFYLRLPEMGIHVFEGAGSFLTVGGNMACGRLLLCISPPVVCILVVTACSAVMINPGWYSIIGGEQGAGEGERGGEVNTR